VSLTETREPGEQGELWTRGYHDVREGLGQRCPTRPAGDRRRGLVTHDGATIDEALRKDNGRSSDLIILVAAKTFTRARSVRVPLATPPRDKVTCRSGCVPDEKYGEGVLPLP